jgi:hypothetical protein
MHRLPPTIWIYKAGLITEKEYEKACGSVMEVKSKDPRPGKVKIAHLQALFSFGYDKEKKVRWTDMFPKETTEKDRGIESR